MKTIINVDGVKMTEQTRGGNEMSKEEANIQILHNADGRKALMINGFEIPGVKKVCYDERPSEVSTVTVEIIPTTFVSDRSSVCTVNLGNKKTAQETKLQEQYIDFSDLLKGYLLLSAIAQ